MALDLTNLANSLNASKLISGKLGNLSGGGSAAILGSVLQNMKTGNVGRSSFNVGSLQGMLNTVLKSGGASKTTNYNYRYKIQTYQVLLAGETDPINLLPEAISKVIITKNYDDHIHPILEVISMLPPKVHKKIKNNKETCKIRLRIQKSLYTSSGTKVRDVDFINGSFDLIMDDESDFKDEDEYDEVNAKTGNGDKYSFNIGDYSLEYTLSLWNRADIDAMRAEVNQIYQNVTLATVIGDIYGNSGIKKIVMSPLDNQDSYDELIVQPMNLMNIPAALEQKYGLYYTGSTVFLDFNRLYFLNKSGVCDAKEDGEYTRTILRVPKANKSTKNRVGTTDDASNKFYYIYINPDNIDFGNPGNSNDAVEGNNFSIVDPQNNETVGVAGAGEQAGEGNSRIVTDNNANPYYKSIMISEVVEKSKVAVVRTMDFDADAFTPNKEFVIMFDDSKLSDKNGFYRLTESQIILNKAKSDLEITGTHRLAFKQAVSVGSEEGTTSVTQKKTMDESAINSEANQAAVGKSTTDSTAEDATNASTESFKPTAPQPKMTGGDESVNISAAGQVKANASPTKDNRYNYDELGNLKGVDVPEYNVVRSTDTKSVANAKIAAQQRSLPCRGPQPAMSA